MGAEKLSTSESHGHVVIELPDLSSDQPQFFSDEQISEWVKKSEGDFVFDFAKAQKLSSTNIPRLLRTFKKLSESNKSSYCLNIPLIIKQEIELRALTKNFVAISDINSIPKNHNTKKTSFDPEVIKSFIEGVKTTFKVQVKVAITAGKPEVKNQLYSAENAVVGQVKVVSTLFTGSVNLCLSEGAFKGIYKGLLGEEPDQVNQETADAAGELMNIIYGFAKRDLNERKGLNLKPSLPTIFVKPNPEQTAGQVICIPFSTDFGSFRIEISF